MRLPLTVLGVVQAHVIRLSIQDELLGIFDSDETLLGWNVEDETLREGGLAGAGGSGDDNVFARLDGEAQKVLVFVFLQESTRSRHYVAMDFTGKVGRIVDNKDLIRGYTPKDGYAYFRRKVSPKDVEPLLTESQAKVHTLRPWFHKVRMPNNKSGY